jgi:peptide/nickel transport system permease protein
LPGDAAEVALGKSATPERLAELRHELDLDRPLPERYVAWIGGVATGDLGTSAIEQAQGIADPSVAHIVREPLRNTLELWAIAALLLVPLTIVLGTIAAVYRGRPSDHVISYGGLILGSLPEFVLGTFLVLIFFTQLGWLPPVALSAPGTNPLSEPDTLILPVVTLLAVSGAFATRQVRAGVSVALDAEYVTMARLNGLSRQMIIRRYALRNALAPSIQSLAQSLQLLFSGLIVVEALFAYPGIGQVLVGAVQSQDVAVVQSVALVLAALFVGINIVADLLVVFAVPKLRTSLS